MTREIHDHYFHQAKRDGYLSRAAYKLIEIDDKRRLLKPGDRVLDCGAAPGSWMQVAARRVGGRVAGRGVVVGIDLQPISFGMRTGRNHGSDGAVVHAVQGDFTTIDPAELLRLAGAEPRGFDVILSDMAPNTTGDPRGDHHRSVRLCHALLDRCPVLLRPGGSVVMKVFEGSDYRDLLDRTKGLFDECRGFKPKASRSESVEIYIIGQGYRSSDPTAPGDPVAAALPAPRKRPGAGWDRAGDAR